MSIDDHQKDFSRKPKQKKEAAFLCCKRMCLILSNNSFVRYVTHFQNIVNKEC